MGLRSFYLKNLFIALLLTIGVFLLVHFVPKVTLVDARGRDIYFKVQHALSERPPQADEITLITLDDETLKRLKRRWPYPRSIYAEVLHKLQPYKPKAVGFDLVFSGNDYTPESDVALAAAMKAAGNAVIASYETNKTDVGPLPMLQESAWRVGRVDKIRDPDFALRRARLSKISDGTERYSWELEIFKKSFPDRDASQYPLREAIPIHYQLKFDEIRQVSFWQLVEGEFNPQDVRDKIVLLGLTAAAFHDFHVTPLGSMPGVAVNANMILMLIRQSFFTFAPEKIVWFLYFLSFWCALVIATFSSVIVGALSFLVLSLCYIGVGYFLFSSKQFIFDPWLLVLGMFVVYFGAIIYRQAQLFIENMRLQEESSRDGLTGFYNRRFLTLKLKSEFKKLLTGQGTFKKNKEISVVMIDLDNFKLVNDTFGHAEGDRVLHAMANTIRKSVRKEELICRFGGDEFCVILPGTVIADAAKFAEKIRDVILHDPQLSYTTKDGTRTIKVTGSIGVASVAGSKSLEQGKLMKAADRALYRAKAGGRNQVCVYDPHRDVIE
jgi:diguanylate cyclase (GGDEF)-like protein